jgi:hypothetical protein
LSSLAVLAGSNWNDKKTLQVEVNNI